MLRYWLLPKIRCVIPKETFITIIGSNQKFKETLFRGAQATVEKILASQKRRMVVLEIMDDEVVDCSEVDSTPFTGIPAPAYLPEDPWFGQLQLF